MVEVANVPAGENWGSRGLPQELRTLAEDSEFAAEAEVLRDKSPARTLTEIALTWLMIVLATGTFVAYPGPITFIVAFFIVGARQYALLILLHDGQHSLLHPSRNVNDLWATWLLGAPCGTVFRKTRQQHLLHHRLVGERQDPAFFYYCSDAPFPKRTKRQLIGHFLSVVLGMQVVYVFRGGPKESGKLPRRDAGAGAGVANAGIGDLSVVILCQAILFSAHALTGSWISYFALWVAPVATVAVLGNAVRLFVEHAKLGSDTAVGNKRLITVLANGLERFFFAPFHMNYHAEHHLFPFIPHYNLPKLYRVMQKSDKWRRQVEIRTSYIGYVIQHLKTLR